jgi:hypothetical protein
MPTISHCPIDKDLNPFRIEPIDDFIVKDRNMLAISLDIYFPTYSHFTPLTAEYTPV